MHLRLYKLALHYNHSTMRKDVILIVGFNGCRTTIFLAKENLETINPKAWMQEIRADYG